MSAVAEQTIPTLPRADESIQLERSGRRWLLGSFAFCPCHLPLTLAVLSVVLGGTSAGALLADNALITGIVVTSLWIAGTAYGFVLVRRSQRGACST
jgi:hypothetical protein